MSGLLNLVSLGPGHADQITPAAMHAIEAAEVIVGYELYLRPILNRLKSKQVITLPLTQERDRAATAILNARLGKSVALVSSGDIGIYAMATLAFELMTEIDDFDVKVFPGITAASSGASLLGAPLSHDFATLSLSDLLCPWREIERRAFHIAEADLAVALYNVQSQTRQTGIYRILEIMLQHKTHTTKCGIVRNAYRQDQSVKICNLEDLRYEIFDMFTTIIIGNKYTLKKGNWIYTPRGYSGWPGEFGTTNTSAKNRSNIAPKIATLSPAAQIGEIELPKEAVWVFAGTSDGNELASKIKRKGHSIVLSVASKYGAEVASMSLPQTPIVIGQIGAKQRSLLMAANQCKAIIDATHPHAAAISTQLIDLSVHLKIPYLRYERPEEDLDQTICTMASSPAEAASLALQKGSRIFLATGVKHLEEILGTNRDAKATWFLRLTPDQESISKAVELGIPRANICAMQGPFSADFNKTLWRQWQIDCVITKESGTKSGLYEKQIAARDLALPFIVIERPAMFYPTYTSTESAVFDYLDNQRRT